MMQESAEEDAGEECALSPQKNLVSHSQSTEVNLSEITNTATTDFPQQGNVLTEDFLETEIVLPKDESFTREQDCADYIVRYLESMGVEYVFGIPGGNIEPFYNALARAEKRGAIKHVTARHESGAVFMAEGYARESGKLGVVCTTTGPGTTNAITGVACAYGNYAPILLISAQTALPTFARGAWQDSSGAAALDTVAMFASITRYNALVSHPDQLEAHLTKAVMCAFGPNRGPVHLSIPRDVFTKPCSERLENFGVGYLSGGMSIKPEVEVQLRLQSLLSQASEVVIWVGNFAKNCSDIILQLAEKNQWRYVTSPGAKGFLPSRHPLCLGVYGVAGHESARACIENFTDGVLLAIGMEFKETNVPGSVCRRGFAVANRLIQISDIYELLSLPSDSLMKVYATPRLVLQDLLNNSHQRTAVSHHISTFLTSANEVFANSPSIKSAELMTKICAKEHRVKPQLLFDFLNRSLPSNTLVAMDSGNSFLWGKYCWNFYHQPTMISNRNLFVIDQGLSSMGWAIGAAIGVALANPSAPVLCITGDGACLMAGQELTVAVELQLKIIFVILNDACLGMVKHGQNLGHAERIAAELPLINFALMAKAQGADSLLIKDMTELQAVDITMAGRNGPLLLDVWIDGDEVPPLKSRVQALHAV